MAGAFGGRWLVLRDLAHDRERLAAALEQVGGVSKRANTASARIEQIALDWPAVAEQSASADEIARRALRETQVAAALATETARRGTELEQAVAANFSITRRKD